MIIFFYYAISPILALITWAMSDKEETYWQILKQGWKEIGEMFKTPKG